MRKFTPLPTFSNVAEGAVATVNCPVGLTYEAIVLAYGGTTFAPANMAKIEVKANGKALWDLSGAQLVALNKFYGVEDSSGFLTLYFARPWMKNIIDQRLTAIGTSDISTLSVHVTISGSTAPELAAHAIQSAAQPLGLVAKIRTFPRSFAVSGQQEIDSLPRGGARIAAVHLFKADVTGVEIDVNGMRVYDASKTLASEVQTQNGRVPVTASATHVDFLLDGDIQHALALVGVQDFRIRPTIATSGAVSTVVEYLDGYDGI